MGPEACEALKTPGSIMPFTQKIKLIMQSWLKSAENKGVHGRIKGADIESNAPKLATNARNAATNGARLGTDDCSVATNGLTKKSDGVKLATNGQNIASSAANRTMNGW